MFTVLDHLKEIYTKTWGKVNAAEVIDEGEIINKQVNDKTFVARKFLSSLVLNVAQANAKSMPETRDTELTDKNMMARGHNRVTSVENFECPAQKLIELDDEEPGIPRSNLEQTFNELIGEQCVVSQPSEQKSAKNERNDRNVSNDKYVELNETDSREDEHSYAAKEKYDWNVRATRINN